ncbi:MAG: hypothetical protein NTZ73_01650 [Candidatus Diapherotrites archaeon]|nr:hypothetical protein [Candidatus Diapherotrites archaeon]
MASKKRSKGSDSYYGDIEEDYSPREYKPSFYGDEEEESAEKEGLLTKLEFFLEDKRNQLIVPVAIVVAIIILLVLMNPGNFSGSGAYSFTDDSGNDVAGTIQHFQDGKADKTINSKGPPLEAVMVSGDSSARVSLRIKGEPLVSPNSIIVKAEGKSTDGKIVWLVENAAVDANGRISFDLFPPEGLPPGEYDVNVLITVLNPDTNETTIITIPVHVTIKDYFSNGCLALNKSSVRESTPFGMLETDFKLKVSCDTKADLNAYVKWNSKQMGTVEVVMADKKGELMGRTLSLSPALLTNSATKSDYPAKIIFTPFVEYAGQKANFSVMFGSDQNGVGINFDVALDNLEQCVKFSKSELVIPKGEESAEITIDASACSSDSIAFYICDGDDGCTGGASEGSIDISPASFSLSPRGNSKKTIMITKGEIPGVYGLTVHANIVGYKKAFIAEKEVFVEPSDEMLKPDKFVISLLGNGTKDSIRVSNPTLAEDVHVNASICDIYANAGEALSADSNSGGSGSTDVNSSSTSKDTSTGGSGWWNNLGKEAGVGKYQASLTETLKQIDEARATAQAFSAPRNALIKKAYLDSIKAHEEALKVKDAAQSAVDAAQAAVDSFGEGTDYGKTVATVQLTLALTELTAQGAVCVVNWGLFTGGDYAVNMYVASVTAAAIAGSVCGPSAATAGTLIAIPAAGKVASSYVTAKTAYEISYFEGFLLILDSVTSMMQAVDSVMTLSEGDGKASADETLEFAKASLESANAAVESSKNAVNYAQKALEAAAIDAFYSASSDDADAKKYLEMAKGAHEETIANLEAATESLNSATDALDDLEETNEFGKSEIIDVIDGLSHITTVLYVARLSELYTAHTAIGSAQAEMVVATGTGGITVIATECLKCSGDEKCAAAYAKCLLITGVGGSDPALRTKLASISSGLTLEMVTSTLDILVTAGDVFAVFLNMMKDTGADIDGAKSAYESTISTYGDVIDVQQKAIDSLDAAIIAAGELSNDEKASSDAATYSSANFADSSYNKKRLAGLIASAVSHGYIAGAYEGGVYTTADTGTALTGTGTGLNTGNIGTSSQTNKFNSNKILLAGDSGSSDSTSAEDEAANFTEGLNKSFTQDCANRIDLGLTDYVINLVKDGKPIGVSNEGVGATWSFSDAKMFDVFEKQEVGVIFSNNGLVKNGYGTVTLNATKHIHGPLAESTDGNGADSSTSSSTEGDDSGLTVTTVKEKPKSSGNEEGGEIVKIDGQPFGPFNIPDASTETVSKKFHFKFNAAPRVEAATGLKLGSCSNGLTRGAEGKDALPNINLSWKWDGFDDSKYLDAAQMSIVLSKKLTAFDEALKSISASCPPNPSLEVLQIVKPSEYLPKDLPKCYLPLTTRLYDGKPALYYFVSGNADEFEKILNFNVKLMKDGFGTKFQQDFTKEYTTKILLSHPSFTDSDKGMAKYFRGANCYYSSEAAGFSASDRFVVPDAGEYSVRLLADLKDTGLFSSGAPSAKIIFQLYPVKPINDSFSVFYYSPFDGAVGMESSTDVIPEDGNVYDANSPGVADQNSPGTDKNGIVVVGGVSKRDGYGFGISGGNDDYFNVDNKGSIIESGSTALLNIPYRNAKSLFEINSLNSMRGKLFDYKYAYNPKGGTDANSYITFAPSFATPLIVSTHANSGEKAQLLYKPMRDSKDINSTSPGFLLLTGIGNGKCRDFSGTSAAKNYFLYPDSKFGGYYGLKFDEAVQGGDIYFKTIIYSPVSESYSIQPIQGTSLHTLQGSNANSAPLKGIGGMVFNDETNNSRIFSLEDLFDAVKQGDVCISNMGNRAMLFWNEGSLSTADASNGHSLSSREDSLSAGCIK